MAVIYTIIWINLSFGGNIMPIENTPVVYVVSLSKKKIGDSDLTSIKLLQQRRIYFHPKGIHGWPANPPEYIGFRYDGRLQSIQQVKAATTVTNIHNTVPEISNPNWSVPHLLYEFGDEIRLTAPVYTGRLFASVRVKCLLNTLVGDNAQNTVLDAVHETHRIQKQNSQHIRIGHNN